MADISEDLRAPDLQPTAVGGALCARLHGDHVAWQQRPTGTKHGWGFNGKNRFARKHSGITSKNCA